MLSELILNPPPALRVEKTSVADLARRWQRSHSEVILDLYHFQDAGLIRFGRTVSPLEKFDIEVLEPRGVTVSGAGLKC